MSSKNLRFPLTPILLTNAAQTVYTAPAGTVTILQHLHCSNPSANAVGFTLSIGANAQATRLYDAFSIPAGSVLDTFCKYVLQPGEVFQALGSTTGILVLTMDGQELTAG